MNRIDRLTTLMKHFPVVVRPAPLSAASLVVTARDESVLSRTAQTIHFKPKGAGFAHIQSDTIFTAKVDWDGTSSPLFPALPEQVQLDVTQDPDMQILISLIRTELTEQRCGSDTVVNRLGEVLMVRLLRGQISKTQSGASTTEPGLLAGLADQRLSLAIVAMHDHPGRAWRNEDLAQIAGLSLSRFAQMFNDTVGMPPAVYLRRWRLSLAHQDLKAGERVERIAHRYGYSSPEGFARAFKKHFGAAPISVRPKQAS